MNKRLSCSIVHMLILASTVTGASSVYGAERRAAIQNRRLKGGQDVATRVTQLLSRMSTQEKIGQLCQLVYVPPEYHVPGVSPAEPISESIAQGKIGSFIYVSDPAITNRLQHIAIEKSPHHIPLLFGADVIHGFRTMFPLPLAMAASWDTDLVARSQGVAAMEARSVGINWTFSPMVDIARDPRWGRIVEGAGEDPFLGSAMSAAQVKGFQGPYIGAPDHLLATAKHFVGYGAAEGGRDYDSSYVSEVQLRNVYFPPFRAAVNAGVGSLMSAYMDLNDVPATGNRWLLHDVLRQEWGFKGFVVSDSDAVKNLQTHGFAKDQQDAAVRALGAGVNVEMALEHDAYGSELSHALHDGKVTIAELDEAVRPILEMKMRLGLFDHPYVDEARSIQVLADAEHRQEARVAAERSIVLLRNESGLLPLKKNAYRHIAVIGPLGNSKWDTLGPNSPAEATAEAVTVVEGLRAKLGTGVTIAYAQGAQLRRTFPSWFDAMTGHKEEPAWSQEKVQQEIDKSVELARSSDIAVMVLGEAQNMSGEAASRDSLELPGSQEVLLEAVAATGKPIVLVLMNGRPLDIQWASAHVPAILESWYPGSQGGNAVANILFGDAVPAGKLPLTWPRSVGQIPIPYAHNTSHAPASQGTRYWDEASTPLYPFGFGLSYTSFHFNNLRIDKNSVRTSDMVNVSGEVTNTGNLLGDEVVQLYIHQRSGGASRPVRELKGFQRISISPGQTVTVHFTLDRKQLAYWNGASHNWRYDPSTYDVWLGDDSNADLHAEFNVTR